MRVLLATSRRPSDHIQIEPALSQRVEEVERGDKLDAVPVKQRIRLVGSWAA